MLVMSAGIVYRVLASTTQAKLACHEGNDLSLDNDVDLQQVSLPLPATKHRQL
jgi:hypothetical protein